jgi:hypothetical protein
VGTYTLTDNDLGAVDISADRKIALLGGYGGLVTVDLSNPANPQEMNFYALPYISQVHVKEDTAYIVANSTVLLLDISTPDSHQELGQWRPFQVLLDVDVSGDLVFVASYVEGLRVLDFSEPAEPKLISRYNQVTDELMGVKVHGSMIYSMHAHNLYAIDAANPEHPFMVGKSGFSGSYPNSLVLKDQYAYHASKSGFSVLDISNPKQPVNVSHFGGRFFQAYGLAVKDNYAFTVFNDTSELYVLDISDPARVKEMTKLSGIEIGGMAVYEDYLYIISSAVGLQVVDISQPTSPELVKTIWINIPAQIDVWEDTFIIEPQILENYLYIPGHRGLETLDITNPADPVWTGVGETGETAFSAAVFGNYAYVVRRDGNLHIFDLSDRGEPESAGILSIAFGARQVYAADHYLYITTKNDQVVIYRIGDCWHNPWLVLPVGESWTVGDMKEISWISPGNWTGNELLNLELYQDNHRIAVIGENIPSAQGALNWWVGAAVNQSLLIEPGTRFNIGLRIRENNCMILSQQSFTIPDPGISLSVEVEKGEDRSVFATRWCNRVDISVSKENNAVEISSYVIKRSNDYGEYEWLDLIPAAMIEKGSYSYFDCSIHEYSEHSYLIEAMHPNGAIVAVHATDRY